MTTMHEAVQAQDQADAVTLFFTEVERICGDDPWISQLGGGILAGIALDIAHSSRAFARALGIEHALVLREIQTLVDLGRLTVSQRNERTQGCTYELVPVPILMPRTAESTGTRGSLTSERIIATSGRADARESRGQCGKTRSSP